MKRYIILFLVILCCFGCKAKYNITINKDLSVTETITGLEDDDFYSKYYNSSKDRVINFVIATKQDYLNQYNYIQKKVTQDKLTGLKVSKTYKNIDEYFNDSIAYQQLYNTFEHTNEDNIITISLNDKLDKNGNSLDRYIIDEGKISITLPFEVIDHNADDYNKNKSTYTWNVNSNNNKKIYIQFDASKLNNKSQKIYVFISFGIILISIMIFIFFLIRKIKINNEL